MRITASELNKRSGTYLSESFKEPVIIEKMGQPFVVMLPYDQYIKLEDAYWGELAINADKEKSLGVKKSKEFLLGRE